MALKLHKEGKTTIPVSILVVLILVALGYWIHPVLGMIFAGLGVILIGLVFNFFRNPDIEIASNPDHVLSPCDGQVVVIEEIEDQKYFKKKVLQISIFMSPLNVHVNRNPITGVMKHVEYLPGKYLMAFNPKSSTLNEQTYMVAGNDRLEVGYKQIAGFLARRIRWYIKEGDQVEQGKEYGFIKYGSRIDLLLPTDIEVKVQLGDKVKAARTVIAQLK
ncbi:MAG: phosphatidylserine decarboxylase family protein [Bacteroidota bacterium]